MASFPDAPISPRGLWKRLGDVVYLCGTLGAAFDQWHRRLALTRAALAYEAQMFGLDEVERLMDRLEAEAREALAPGETLAPRRSPGYGEIPLDFSRTILDVLDATRRLGVALTESNLLVPSKTVTAICRVNR